MVDMTNRHTYPDDVTLGQAAERVAMAAERKLRRHGTGSGRAPAR